PLTPSSLYTLFPYTTLFRSLRYGSALVAVALATAGRRLLDPSLGDHQPFATYFLAVIFTAWYGGLGPSLVALVLGGVAATYLFVDRKSTRLNSSHLGISYAV